MNLYSPVPNFITSVTTESVSTTSTSLTINYNPSIMIERPSDFTVHVTLTSIASAPSPVLSLSGPQSILLSGLEAQTSYTGTVQVVSNSDTTIGSDNISFTTIGESLNTTVSIRAAYKPCLFVYHARQIWVHILSV